MRGKIDFGVLCVIYCYLLSANGWGRNRYRKALMIICLECVVGIIEKQGITTMITKADIFLMQRDFLAPPDR